MKKINDTKLEPNDVLQEEGRSFRYFGQTDFILNETASEEMYYVCDATYDRFNIVLKISKSLPPESLQEAFDFWYKGYVYGFNGGEEFGESNFKFKFKKFLNIKD